MAAVAHALVEMGAFEVAVSDTIGIAHPGQVPDVVGAVAERVPLAKVALHFHDTRGTALANVLTALDLGVATFDASAGGLGGCPYAPGATGNLATEDLIYMLDGLGIETGVNLDALVDASAFIEARIGHRLPSRYYRAGQELGGCRTSSRAVLARASGRHGFSSTRLQPTSRARCSCARPPCPLRQMTGTCRVESFPRIWRMSSKPSMPGSVKSVITSAGTRVCEQRERFLAVAAASTSNDALRNSAYISRVSA